MTNSSMRNKLVVITGASSGIGKATALAFAREGARLILASRSAEPLEKVALECRQAGSSLAKTAVIDVTRIEDIKKLASIAAEPTNGGIDVWVNNAGTGTVGGFLETSMEAHEQVIRTNLLGYIHGAHVAISQFIKQGYGVLINNISLGAWLPLPYSVAYSASKFGLEGYSQALRDELRPWSDIYICDIYPSVVNTPGLARHTPSANGNNDNWSVAGLGISPHQVGKAILKRAKYPATARTSVGALSHVSRLAHSLFPITTRTVAGVSSGLLFRQKPSKQPTDGALFHPGSKGECLGADPTPRKQAQTLAMAGVAMTVGWWLGRPRRARHH